MLSLVTDYQWNRKHIFLKSLTLISKLFPYWNKTDPRRVKLRLFFFFPSQNKSSARKHYFFSRPPVGADKQKYLCTLHRAMLSEILGWKLSKSRESWASQWVFSWPVWHVGERHYKNEQKPVWAAYSAILYYAAKAVGYILQPGGTRGRWCFLGVDGPKDRSWCLKRVL